MQSQDDEKRGSQMAKSTRDDEEELIARSQHGDIHAFNQLVLCYQQTTYSFILRMLGNPDVAADVTQDTFIAAFRGIASFHQGSSFRAWLLRIASNMVYNYWRRVQRRPAESLDQLANEEESRGINLLNTLAATGLDQNPEERLLNQELQALLQRGLQALPPDQRTAIILCDIEGLSYEEIAESTQAALGTVRSRIARGRARLRAYLIQHRELLPRPYRLSNE